MKNREIESAKKLMFKALVKLGANEEFAQEIVDEAAQDLNSNYKDEFVVDGVMHSGCLIQLANQINEDKKVIYSGTECICSPKGILYLYADEGIKPSLVMKEYDSIETFSGAFIGVSDAVCKFVGLEQLNWACGANF